MNIVVAAGYGLTIVAGAVGEWNYFILGSVVEAILLALVIRYAWTWPKADHPAQRRSSAGFAGASERAGGGSFLCGEPGSRSQRL